MARIGSKKKPAILRVQTEDRAVEVMNMANDAEVTFIVGIEPEKPEDISDLKRAINKESAISLIPRKARPSKNAPCPCGSGRKYKGCCGKEKA